MRTVEVDTLTVNNLGRHFNPKPLLFGIMEVDKLREEEHNRCAPEHCDRSVRLGDMARNEGGIPTAMP